MIAAKQWNRISLGFMSHDQEDSWEQALSHFPVQCWNAGADAKFWLDCGILWIGAYWVAEGELSLLCWVSSLSLAALSRFSVWKCSKTEPDGTSHAVVAAACCSLTLPCQYHSISLLWLTTITALYLTTNVSRLTGPNNRKIEQRKTEPAQTHYS